jgi:hypothetical protein
MTNFSPTKTTLFLGKRMTDLEKKEIAKQLSQNQS